MTNLNPQVTYRGPNGPYHCDLLGKLKVDDNGDIYDIQVIYFSSSGRSHDPSEAVASFYPYNHDGTLNEKVKYSLPINQLLEWAGIPERKPIDAVKIMRKKKKLTINDRGVAHA